MHTHIYTLFTSKYFTSVTLVILSSCWFTYLYMNYKSMPSYTPVRWLPENSKSSSWSQCFRERRDRGVALANSRLAKCQSKICRSREDRYTSLKNIACSVLLTFGSNIISTKFTSQEKISLCEGKCLQRTVNLKYTINLILYLLASFYFVELTLFQHSFSYTTVSSYPNWVLDVVTSTTPSFASNSPLPYMKQK